MGFRLHAFRQGADGVQVQRRHLPNRLALDEAAYVLAPDQRNVLTELAAVNVQQASAMFALLSRHLCEDVRTACIVTAQPLGNVQVDTAVLFLVGNRQGKDFTFAQFGKISHGRECGCPGQPVKWEA